ncbi:hypothetical protein WMO41_15625 [Ventrimonas sp. CLA-AP-H27]|uniref:Uncharacterized protein n=1 Tax=Ventrimonas faecis TaxID=3133170 RepID=A0ABV1HQI7_9FIRM
MVLKVEDLKAFLKEKGFLTFEGFSFNQPEERFMRHNSDQNWEGWIYWSFILLFQRLEDGPVMENGWFVVDAVIFLFYYPGKCVSMKE